MTLTTDCFGRTKVTHVCPDCGARFLGPAECRPCPANGFAHKEKGNVVALPLVGCDEPPPVTYAIGLPINVKARSWEQAYEMGVAIIERTFPKRAAERMVGHLFPVELETRAEVVAAALGKTQQSGGSA